MIPSCKDQGFGAMHLFDILIFTSHDHNGSLAAITMVAFLPECGDRSVNRRQKSKKNGKFITTKILLL